MDARECSSQGVLAQKDGALDRAVILFTHGIQLTPSSRPDLAANLLRDRAGCYWDLQRKEEACMDMKRALELFPGVKVTGPVGNCHLPIYLFVGSEYIYPHSTTKFTFKKYFNSHLTMCFLFRSIFPHIYEMYSFTFNGLYSFTFTKAVL